MGTVVRLYLGWRLFRLLRPLLGVALVASVALALHQGHARMHGSAASTVQRGIAAAKRDLPRALERAFEPGLARP